MIRIGLRVRTTPQGGRRAADRGQVQALRCLKAASITQPQAARRNRRRNLKRGGSPRKRVSPSCHAQHSGASLRRLATATAAKRMRGTRPRSAENIQENGGATRVGREKPLERLKPKGA